MISAFDSTTLAPAPTAPAALSPRSKSTAGEARAAFDDFVGQTFFTQLLSQMRKTVDKPAYFHGGQTEEVFQGQLDQVLSEKLSEATAEKFSGPMFDLFMLRR